MSPNPAFREELDAINQDLRTSLTRLEVLLSSTRSELAGAVKEKDRLHLETVVRELERKLQELRSIGLIGQR